MLFAAQVSVPGRPELAARSALASTVRTPPPAAWARLQQTVGNRAVQQILRSSGEPLQDGLRRSMTSRLGHELDGVRLHRGEDAHRAARLLDADAFTVGRHIVFAEGAYDEKTLAHELTHVVQQDGRDAGSASLHLRPANDVWEQEAARVASGAQPVPRASRGAVPAGSIQREPCRETQRSDSWQHTLVELWYQYMHNPFSLYHEYEIPQGGIDGTTGYADLVDERSGEVWDIVSQSDIIASKLAGLRVYIRQADTHCGGHHRAGWSLPADFIPNPEDPVLIVTPLMRGLLQWRYPEPLHVPVTVLEQRGRRLVQTLPFFRSAPRPGEVARWGADVSGTEVGRETITPSLPRQVYARDGLVESPFIRALALLAVTGLAIGAVYVLAAAIAQAAATLTVVQVALMLQRLVTLGAAALTALSRMARSDLVRHLEAMPHSRRPTTRRAAALSPAPESTRMPRAPAAPTSPPPPRPRADTTAPSLHTAPAPRP